MDQSGNLKWNIQKNGQEIFSSPALSSDESTLYIGIGSQLVAFDAATGSENWSFNTGGPVYSSPSVSSDGNIYVGSFDGKLYSIDASGNLNWENEIRKIHQLVEYLQLLRFPWMKRLFILELMRADIRCWSRTIWKQTS